MSKTWWGHYIIVDKGEEYIRFKDYLELSNRIDKAIKYIKENEKEYGSLEDNEKIILKILKGGNNE